MARIAVSIPKRFDYLDFGTGPQLVIYEDVVGVGRTAHISEYHGRHRADDQRPGVNLAATGWAL